MRSLRSSLSLARHARHALHAACALVALATGGCAQGNIDDHSTTTADDDAAGPSGQTHDAASSTDSAPSSSDGAPSSPCPLCVTDADCNKGSSCAQFGSDIYCAPTCNSNADCSADRACVAVSDYKGDQVSVCVPRADVCGPSPTGGGSDAGTTSDAGSPGSPPPSDASSPPTGGSSEHCGTMVGPDVAASCASCGSHTCQANGCYGGWWCDTATSKCHAPPAPSACGSTSSDAGAPPPSDAGTLPPPTGTIGPSGGTTSSLLFAVVGDTRPPTIDDTSGYPTAIVTKIYDDITSLSPSPSFVVSTGDYVFASASGTQAAPQMDLYLAARAHYPGAWFPAMGNHECTGATASNCGPGTTDGLTNNYQQFISKLLGPIGKTTPYYSIRVDATDGSWTSKFVFVAANAWTTEQATWLDTTLAVPTTYTFVLRHEPDAATSPGTSASNSIISKYPLTLKIVGHTHLYEHPTKNEVVVGNGGAPLTGSSNYGFALVTQRADKSIRVDMVDYSTKAIDSSFAFALNPDGSAATP